MATQGMSDTSQITDFCLDHTTRCHTFMTDIFIHDELLANSAEFLQSDQSIKVNPVSVHNAQCTSLAIL